MTVYVCQDNFESMLCGVYDAWMSKKGHSNVRLELEGSGSMELFCTYESVEVTEEKYQKVVAAIVEKISKYAYELVYRVSLSQREDRPDVIYRFLIYGFHYGAGVTDMLQIPAVFDVFSIQRNIFNEEHHLMGFARFSQMDGGVLLCRIGPKNHLLPLLAVHFADRLSGENWILYDTNRQIAAVHRAGAGWVMVSADTKEWQERLTNHTDEEEYQSLWKAFHESIAIKERENPRCQRNFLPLRFRPYMTEFQREGE